MKETKKCSISGLSFIMEEDAYNTLKEYLDSLNKAYKEQPDGSEIIADIEARIAELILSTQDNGRVVERPLIMNIIAQLGTAEDITEESTIEEPTRTQHGEPRIPRRLYRDMEYARLGGVCAGLAKYFNVEATWIRLACCAPILLFILGNGWISNIGGNILGVAILSYIVMWIAVPAARTARQKLEANGEKITVQSIREASSNNNKSDIDSMARPVMAETVTIFGRILIFLLKMFAALIVFVLILFAMVLFLGLWVLLFASSEVFGDMGSTGEILMSISNGTWIAVLTVFAVLIPTIILLYILINLLLGPKPNRWALLIMVLLWIATMIALLVAAIKDNLPNLYTNHKTYNTEYIEEHERLHDSISNAAKMYEIGAADTIVISIDNTAGLKSIDRD